MKTSDEAVDVALYIFWYQDESYSNDRVAISKAVKAFYDDATNEDLEFNSVHEIATYIVNEPKYWEN